VVVSFKVCCLSPRDWFCIGYGYGARGSLLRRRGLRPLVSGDKDCDERFRKGRG